MLYPLLSRKASEVYWRYRHPVTGKYHCPRVTMKPRPKAIAVEANTRLAEQQKPTSYGY